MLWREQLWRLQQSGKFLIGVTYLSFFLDNLLLSVVVPIIPDVLYKMENETLERTNLNMVAVENKENCSGVPLDCQNHSSNAYVSFHRRIASYDMNDENEEVGLLLASKAIVQLVMNPVVGPLTNRIGNQTPIFFGVLTLLLSSLLFAFGNTFSVLFAARSLHGIGSSCICIGGMAVIADRYQDDQERSRIMGIIMGGIAAGVLVGYPLGGVLYDFVSQSAPLLIVSGFLFLDAVLLLVVLRPRLEPERLLVGTSIRKLIRDPYILLAAGAISISTFSIAILEPCLPIWLMESMSPPRWQLGTVFIPDSLGYFVGTNFFGEVGFKVGRWVTAMVSLFIVGVCALMIPISTHILQLVIPHFGLGLGIGVIDASLMPLLANIVDVRYMGLYGSVYAIAEMAVCLAYSIGPLFGGYLVKKMGFTWVMRCIGILNLLYCPLCYFLREIPRQKGENRPINSNGPECNSKEPTKTDGWASYFSFANEE
ncbi:synaptic vesicular amine transporter-like [Argiope bruennichi]|uniref:Chromaffin granule amine transporter like protein n=1 Tax=Argiope bruennichi TaxID=94029 RepID=A0A8T0FKH7_ARGBR|nr:synaptic vesicular amine transporter-like [Argiope bruennichi]KAF8790875.1 Chromaffin granule amine transporter like protein [Argiope bruennichi]